MDRRDLPDFGGESECLGTDTKKFGRLREIEPRLNSICRRSIHWNPMMGSQRSDALARPAIAMAGRQLIPIENARDQIIVRNEHQLSYGLDDVRRGGVALAVAPPGQSSSVWTPPIQWMTRTISAAL